MREILRMAAWRLFGGGRVEHFELGVPDQSEIIYRDSLTAVIERGGAL